MEETDEQSQRKRRARRRKESKPTLSKLSTSSTHSSSKSTTKRSRTTSNKASSSTSNTSASSATGKGNTHSSTNEDLVNPEWRTPRKTAQRGRRSLPSFLPSSPQEIQLWLQQGGWRIVAGGAVLFLVMVVVVLSLGRDGQTGSSPEMGNNGAANTNIPTAPPPPTPVPQPTVFVVRGTGQAGLILRADHSATSAVRESLVDGTRVEQIGEDVVGTNYVWRPVRTPSGVEGWVAVDWLEPAP